MALIGYARVSTAEQDTALQTDALHKAGCKPIFEDTISGVKAERPGLASAMAFLRGFCRVVDPKAKFSRMVLAPQTGRIFPARA